MRFRVDLIKLVSLFLVLGCIMVSVLRSVVLIIHLCLLLLKRLGLRTLCSGW